MANPQKFARVQPVRAGQMSAQNPTANDRKQALLGRDLEGRKAERAQKAKALFFADSPYIVQPEDEFLLVNASGGQTTVRLPPTAASTDRLPLIIHKRDSSANAVHVTPGDQINDVIVTASFTGLNAYIKTQGGGLTLVVPDIPDFAAWAAISQLGTVDPTP